MNARTEAERSAGASSAWTAELGKIDGTAAQRTARGGVKAMAAPTQLDRHDEEQDRLSIDPLRATDRYRLVIPYTLGL